MLDIEIYEIALLPIIIGLVEIAKQFKIPAKYTPLVSIAIAEMISIVFVADGDYKKAVLVGLQLGLAAVGLYSGVKCIRSEKKK